MKAGRIVSLIIGSVLLMLFCIPLVSRILNLGNLVGILFGATLVSYGIFADKDTATAYAVIKENCREVYDEDGAFILCAYNHPALSSDYCRHVIGEAPSMPDEIKAGYEPFELKRPTISSAAELKNIAEGLWK